MFPVTQIFSVSVSTYAIFIVIGFAVGLLCAFLRRRINGVRADDLVACLFIAAAGALIGGKLFFMVQGFPVFLAHAREEGYTFLEYFMDAGLVYYGGFIGGIVFLILAAKLIKTPVWAMVDTILPSIPLMHAVGRVGCFSAGCCYGIPCDFGVVFDASPIAPHGVRLLPVQLIESACLLVLFFSHAALWETKKAARKSPCVLPGWLRDYPLHTRIFPLRRNSRDLRRTFHFPMDQPRAHRPRRVFLVPVSANQKEKDPGLSLFRNARPPVRPVAHLWFLPKLYANKILFKKSVCPAFGWEIHDADQHRNFSALHLSRKCSFLVSPKKNQKSSDGSMPSTHSAGGRRQRLQTGNRDVSFLHFLYYGNK